MSFKVQNWSAYEAGLRRRGSLILWIEDAALDCWQTCGPSGQARFKDVAIQTSLMLRTAFKLALRQAEGLMISVLTLMGLTLSTPDHTTVSRRAVTQPVMQPASVPHGPLHVLIDSTGLQVYGAGQWLEAKHGAKSRRTWRKLHLAVDAASGMIVAQTLTDQDTDDPSQVGPLLDQIDDPIAWVTADGAYDSVSTYQTIAACGDGIDVVIPPRSTAVASGEPGPLSQRDRHLEMITEQGRLAWYAATDYGRRSLVETTMGRYKALIGPRLRVRGFGAQQAEAAFQHQNQLDLALQKLGRIERTLFMLDWLESSELRQRCQAGLNKSEQRHALAQVICTFKQGRIADRGQEAQQFRASGLNLVIAAIVYWNSTYIADAVEHLQAQGKLPPAALLAHTSPLTWEHIGFSEDFLWDRAAITAGLRRSLNIRRIKAAAFI